MVKKKDEKYECEECGIVVVVDNPCGFSPCNLTCCNIPMKEVKKKTKV